MKHWRKLVETGDTVKTDDIWNELYEPISGTVAGTEDIYVVLNDGTKVPGDRLKFAEYKKGILKTLLKTDVNMDHNSKSQEETSDFYDGWLCGMIAHTKDESKKWKDVQCSALAQYYDHMTEAYKNARYHYKMLKE